MTAQPANIPVLDGRGVEFLQRVYDLSGTGAGPWLPITLVVGPDGQTLVDFGALLNGIITKLSAVGLATGSKVGLQIGGVDVAAGNPLFDRIVGVDYAAAGATDVTGTATVGTTAAFVPKAGRACYLVLSGSGSASGWLELSFDGGTTWCQISVEQTQLGLFNFTGSANLVVPIATVEKASFQVRANFQVVTGTPAFQFTA